jgi:hypothetical protein
MNINLTIRLSEKQPRLVLRMILRYAKVSLEFIEKHIGNDVWLWFLLSKNNNVIFTYDFLIEHRNKLIWSEISKKTNIEWNLDILDQLKEYINWEIISENKSVNWDVDKILKFEKYINFKRLFEIHPHLYEIENWKIIGIKSVKYMSIVSASENIKWSQNLLQEFDTLLDWRNLSRNKSIPWTYELVDKYKNKIDWSSFVFNPSIPLSSEFISEFRKYWENAAVITYRSIYRMSDYWKDLSSNLTKKWTSEIIRKYLSELDWTRLRANESMLCNDEIIINIPEVFNYIGSIRENDNQILNQINKLNNTFADKELIDINSIFNEAKEWKWHILSRNENINWTNELIYTYKDLIDWRLFSQNQSLILNFETLFCFKEYWNWYFVLQNKKIIWKPYYKYFFNDKLNTCIQDEIKYQIDSDYYKYLFEQKNKEINNQQLKNKIIKDIQTKFYNNTRVRQFDIIRHVKEYSEFIDWDVLSLNESIIWTKELIQLAPNKLNLKNLKNINDSDISLLQSLYDKWPLNFLDLIYENYNFIILDFYIKCSISLDFQVNNKILCYDKFVSYLVTKTPDNEVENFFYIINDEAFKQYIYSSKGSDIFINRKHLYKSFIKRLGHIEWTSNLLEEQLDQMDFIVFNLLQNESLFNISLSEFDEPFYEYLLFKNNSVDIYILKNLKENLNSYHLPALIMHSQYYNDIILDFNNNDVIMQIISEYPHIPIPDKSKAICKSEVNVNFNIFFKIEDNETKPYIDSYNRFSDLQIPNLNFEYFENLRRKEEISLVNICLIESFLWCKNYVMWDRKFCEKFYESIISKLNYNELVDLIKHLAAKITNNKLIDTWNLIEEQLNKRNERPSYTKKELRQLNNDAFEGQFDLMDSSEND